MRILGFKLRRYAEWCKVLRIEFGRVTFRDKLRLVATILRSIRLKRDKEFRGKYRCCCRCVLYDRNLRRCRPFDDSNAGCGCYMPFKIAFGGGCQGCGMVDVTLRQGVEVMITEGVPDVSGVIDMTDHEAGTNPFY